MVEIRYQEGGFIALTSVLIISSLLLIQSATVGNMSIMTHISLMKLGEKSKTDLVARGCLEVARIAIINDPLFSTVNRTVKVTPYESCNIEQVIPLSPDLGFSTVIVSSSSTYSESRYRAVIGHVTGSTTRFESVVN
jgi:hypothetical protein